MASTETLEEIKARVKQVTPEETRAALETGEAVLIDTRDAVNREDARIEGDHYAPAGQGASVAHNEEFAERVEQAAGDRSKPVILYCGAGNRSAVAADVLTKEHGFEDVASMSGGLTLWEIQGLPVAIPEGMSPEQRNRYSRHTLLPEVGIEGQLKMLNAKVLLIGAGDLGAPSALYLAA